MVKKLILTLLLIIIPALCFAGPPSPKEVSNEAYNATTWDGVKNKAPSKDAVRDVIEGLADGHDAVTLDANADAILSLATQEVGLDTQTANTVLAGPTTGAAAVPAFRSLVVADVPGVVDADYGDVTVASGTWTIDADTIIEPDLSVDNAPADNDLLGYDPTGTNFEWFSPDEVAANMTSTGADAIAGNITAGALGASVVKQANIDYGDGLAADGTSLILDLTDPHTWTGTQTLPNESYTIYSSVPIPESNKPYCFDNDNADPCNVPGLDDYCAHAALQESGTHTAVAGATLTDSAATFTVDALIGMYLINDTQSLMAVITDNDATTITASMGSNWETNDVYRVIDWVASYKTNGTKFFSSIPVPTLEEDELNDDAGDRLLTADELKGTILSNGGMIADLHYDFPARAEGWNFIVIVEAAYQITLDPNGTEQWYLNGTQLSAGENIQNAADTPGESIACFSTETAVYCESKYSNWAEETP